MVKTQIKPRIERIQKVWIPDVKLWIPHNDQELGFAYPSFGPNYYQNVGKEILEHDLDLPTGDYTTSLVHAAYCDTEVLGESEFKNTRDLMRNGGLWVFNQNLWTSEGVYVVQDLDAKGRSQDLDVNELEKVLNNAKESNGLRISEDRKVRFAPKDTYKLGDHTSESLAKDGFIRASYSEEGAEKLAEVSTKFRINPYVYGLDVQEGDKPEQRVSALGGDDERLRVSGNDFSGDDTGHAFGVLK